jgi:Predicted methyltransferase regulatory domain/Methyltransferase domain
MSWQSDVLEGAAPMRLNAPGLNAPGSNTPGLNTLGFNAPGSHPAKWNSGYVTDVAYTFGYYPEQSPHHLALCCLLGNAMPGFARPGLVRPGLVHQDDRLTYVEFGCGRGFGTLCLAASNPDWQVIGIDFMPVHVAEARELAERAGIRNVSFIEADLSTLDPDTLPEIDVASAHGVWSWVADPVRQGVVRILADRLRAGGMFHVSYNALPAWQGALGLQRLMRDATGSSGGRSDRRAAAAIATVQALQASGAVHLDHTPLVKTLVRDLPRMPPEYLAHEYMNEAWRPCFHADVAGALAAAKLEYVASGDVLENFPALMLTDQQRLVFDGIAEPALRELVKDICLPRGLRHDVYVRGARWIDNMARDAMLRELTVMLARPAEEFSYEAQLPAGRASLERRFYQPVVEALSAGPLQVGSLLRLGPTQAGRENAAELVGMLVGTSQAMLVARPDAGLGDAATELNAVMAERLLGGRLGRAGALASLRLGAGLRCSAEDHVAAWLYHRFGADGTVESWADHLQLAHGGEGRTAFIRGAETTRERLSSVWRHAAVV